MPPQVLLLEPDGLSRDLIALALTRAGYPVAVCPEPAALPLALEHTRPALLILEAILPGTNGLALLSELSAQGRLQGTRVMVLSSLSFPNVVRQARQAGADDFLLKPVDSQQLVERARRLVG